MIDLIYAFLTNEWDRILIGVILPLAFVSAILIYGAYRERKESKTN